MPASARYWTVDDLQGLPDNGNRYEVIDGELLVTPAPSLIHQRPVLVLCRALADYLDREPIGDLVISPADVVFSQRRSVQPDLFVMPLAAGRRPRLFSDVGRPLLAVEVLSPSTARADRVEKRALFRSEGVDEYWIVDLDARTIERSTPLDTRIEVFDDAIEWSPSGASTPLTIDLSNYFRRVLDD
ncbi:MAG TPA: Uma2 family endonuclease [Gemmatimonadaceae bacterium]